MADLDLSHPLRRIRHVAPTKFRALVLMYCGTLISIQGSVTAVLSGWTGQSTGNVLLSLTGIIFIFQGASQLRDNTSSQSSTYGWIEYALVVFGVFLTVTFIGFLLVLR